MSLTCINEDDKTTYSLCIYSLTYIYEENETTPFVCIFNRLDGDIVCLGLTIAKFLNSKILVNGISDDNTIVFEGMGCLAAQLVAHMKNGNEVAGNTCIVAPRLDHDLLQEYEYHIWPGKIKVVRNFDDDYKPVAPSNSIEYEGTWEDFLQYCMTYGDWEEETA